MFKSSSSNSGCASWSGSIDVLINADTRFPYREAHHGEYLGVTVNSLQELAVSLTAHEARHVWQMRVLGVCSELDADAWSLLALKLYRTGDLHIAAGIPMEPPCDPEAETLGEICEAIVEKQFAGHSTH